MDSGIEQAVRTAAATLPLAPADVAAVELAAAYAAAIDQGVSPVTAGPALLAALEALGMTPRSRAALMKGATGEPQQRNPLDELREQRRKRTG